MHRAFIIVATGLAAQIGVGCLVTTPNLDYCANSNGNLFCEQRHPDDGRGYCIRGIDACLDGLSNAYKSDPSFDGCIEDKPEDACYSPCGGGQSIEDEASCVVASDDTIGMGETTPASSGTAEMTGADDTTTGSTASSDSEPSEGTTTGSNTTDASSSSSSSSSSDGSTTTDASSSSEDSTTGDMCLGSWGSGAWGGCLNEYGVFTIDESCDPGAACLVYGSDFIESTSCTTSCSEPCDCPPPPATGNAVVDCADIVDGDGVSECHLDCSGDETSCPDGMVCVDETFCATPTEPAPMYGSCAAGCELPGECAVTASESHSVCVTPCYDADSCSAAPAGFTAVGTCDGAVSPPVGPNGVECYLDCSAGATCPSGMDCIAVDEMSHVHQDICMWPTF
jgi:hypothetical protein